ncbi:MULTISPECIES: DUF917 domain-containing protein [Haloferax]|uniref:DUF917 family protein n=2 Tax=Haloferax gibbonsii TaxID=35746 RepID=A0A0K1ITQ4_HALGI|nr:MULTISPECIES: DUF917 family protein [Haloferax]AKU07804.1 OsrF [Haloferax gibbonsii]ELZ79388.1 OsrF [Haloferax gibbonsii ATCC 33959]QOS13140.1 DUF917 family protein [Haloferax gibbonsii]REA02367.1 DUF917 domain-containing protein [Haloferax sp. Atlit-6N]
MTTDDTRTQTDGTQRAARDDAAPTDETRPEPTGGERTITAEWVEDVAVGGAVLGGGGGGSLAKGIEFGELAVEYGRPTIVSVADLDPTDVVLTVSGVGAPAATDSHVDPADYVRAVELLVDRLAADGTTVGALMTNEMGGFATVNGLLQSAVTGLPLVDAACNGRAHPTGPMGSIGLSQDSESVQAAVGGVPGTAARLETVVEAELGTAASLVRHAAEDAGGLVAVARNPVPASYAEAHAALDTYDQAEAVGRAVRLADDGRDAAERVADAVGGEVSLVGPVESFALETTGGFDVGEVEIEGRELTFWNEYMTLELDGERLATFPDLITTLDAETGMPVSTAELAEGRSVAVVVAPAANLSLGAGMADPALFDPVEQAVGKAVKSHVFN